MRALSCLVGFNAGGRKEYSMFRFSLLTLAALAATAAQGREAPFGSATEQTVRETCGENLKTSDGGFGCTIVQDGEARDYICNANPELGRPECRVHFRGATSKSGTGAAPSMGR
jgi:hypothetical protein